MTMKAFVNTHRITATTEYADSNPYMDDDRQDSGRRHWRVKLRYQRRQLTIPFTQGSAHTSEPTAADVLGCVISDTTGFDNASSFEEWCTDYGYDSDSRKAERMYKDVEKQAAKVKRFLGDVYDDATKAEW